VPCSQCQSAAIVGVRYRCLTCSSFDLCANCEAVSEHQHSLLKIKWPGQSQEFEKVLQLPFKQLMSVQRAEGSKDISYEAAGW